MDDAGCRMRTPEELLAALDAATPENPIVLGPNETEVLAQALRRRNRSAGRKAFEINPDYQGYDCPITGRFIEGRAAHRENLKRHGCRNLEKGEHEWAAKRREENRREAAERTAREMVDRVAPHIEI